MLDFFLTSFFSSPINLAIKPSGLKQKLCAKWVPRVLTIDQKQQRVVDSGQC
jgi:hypothetical protein